MGQHRYRVGKPPVECRCSIVLASFGVLLLMSVEHQPNVNSLSYMKLKEGYMKLKLLFELQVINVIILVHNKKDQIALIIVPVSLER